MSEILSSSDDDNDYFNSNLINISDEYIANNNDSENETKKNILDLKKLHQRSQYSVQKNIDTKHDLFTCNFSLNDEYLAIGTSNGNINLYYNQFFNKKADDSETVENYKLAYTLQDNSYDNLPVTCLKFRPSSISDNNHILLAGYSNGMISHWHVESKSKIFSIQQENNQIFGIDYSKDGKTFATCGMKPIINIYDEATKSLISHLDASANANAVAHSSRVYSLKFDPKDVNILYSGGWDNTIQIWDLRMKLSVRSIYGPHICGDAISIHPNKNILLTGSYRPNNPLELWDISSGKVIHQDEWYGSNESSQMLYAATFSNDGAYFAAGGVGNKLGQARLYNATTFEPIDYVEFNDAPIYSLEFNHSSTELAIAPGNTQFFTVLKLKI